MARPDRVRDTYPTHGGERRDRSLDLDYVAAGDFVLIPSRQRAVGRGGGAETEITLTTLYELSEGKIIRMHQYESLAEARAAASIA